MRALSEAWNAWRGTGNDFIRAWEAKHPACGATVEDLGKAFWCGYGYGGNDGFKEFLRILGQEQPERLGGPCLAVYKEMERQRDQWRTNCGQRDKRIEELSDAANERAEKAENSLALVEEQRDQLADSVKLSREARQKAEAEVERLKTQLTEWGKEMIRCGERECAVAGREANLDWLRQRVKDLKAEVERLKAREASDLADIEGALDGEDTLGATIRRLREENERPKAQPIPDEAVRMIARAVLRWLWPTSWKQWEGPALDAALAEARQKAEAEVERLKAQPFPEEAVRAIVNVAIRKLHHWPEGKPMHDAALALAYEAALAEAAKWGLRFEVGQSWLDDGREVVIVNLGPAVRVEWRHGTCVDSWWAKTEQLKPLPPEPEENEPPRCGCGACVRDASAIPWPWSCQFEDGTTDQLPDGKSCRDCGAQLTAAAGEEGGPE